MLWCRLLRLKKINKKTHVWMSWLHGDYDRNIDIHIIIGMLQLGLWRVSNRCTSLALNRMRRNDKIKEAANKKTLKDDITIRREVRQTKILYLWEQGWTRRIWSIVRGNVAAVNWYPTRTWILIDNSIWNLTRHPQPHRQHPRRSLSCSVQLQGDGLALRIWVWDRTW